MLLAVCCGDLHCLISEVVIRNLPLLTSHISVVSQWKNSPLICVSLVCQISNCPPFQPSGFDMKPHTLFCTRGQNNFTAESCRSSMNAEILLMSTLEPDVFNTIGSTLPTFSTLLCTILVLDSLGLLMSASLKLMHPFAPVCQKQHLSLQGWYCHALCGYFCLYNTTERGGFRIIITYLMIAQLVLWGTLTKAYQSNIEA
jgi:hypothetical protein